MIRDIWVDSEAEVARLGFSAKYKGYFYLVIAAVLFFKTGLRKEVLCSVIYQRIAEMSGVTSQSVEKAVRASIIKAWSQEVGALRNSFSGYGRKPTNGEVIAFITSRLRLETESPI